MANNFDYPPGADADPRAPWHQVDAEDCEACDGEGRVTCTGCGGTGSEACTGGAWVGCCPGEGCGFHRWPGIVDCRECDGTKTFECEDCNGSGTVPEPDPQDEADRRADDECDRRRDEAAERRHGGAE